MQAAWMHNVKVPYMMFFMLPALVNKVHLQEVTLINVIHVDMNFIDPKLGHHTVNCMSFNIKHRGGK